MYFSHIFSENKPRYFKIKVSLLQISDILRLRKEKRNTSKICLYGNTIN